MEKIDQCYEMLRHYSSRIFAARVLVIGLCISGLALASGADITDITLQVTRADRAQFSLFGAMLIAMLWLMEMGYFIKYNKTVLRGKKLEEGEGWFGDLEAFTHIWVYVFYLLTIIGILILVYREHNRGDLPSGGWFAVPIGLTLVVIVQMSKIAWAWQKHDYAKANLVAVCLSPRFVYSWMEKPHRFPKWLRKQCERQTPESQGPNGDSK